MRLPFCKLSPIMKKIIALFFLALAVRCVAADGVAAFRNGLQAFQTNGPDALLRSWYDSNDQAKIETIRARLVKATQGFGEVVDTEVFAPKSIGKHIQRLYGVIYFSEHPLWIRAEYYTINGRGGFLSMEFSRDADDILPLEIGVAGGG